MNHIYDHNKLAENYLNLSNDSIIYINTFGEPFFNGEDNLYKVSVETGDIETVNTSII